MAEPVEDVVDDTEWDPVHVRAQALLLEYALSLRASSAPWAAACEALLNGDEPMIAVACDSSAASQQLLNLGYVKQSLLDAGSREVLLTDDGVITVRLGLGDYADELYDQFVTDVKMQCVLDTMRGDEFRVSVLRQKISDKFPEPSPHLELLQDFLVKLKRAENKEKVVEDMLAAHSLEAFVDTWDQRFDHIAASMPLPALVDLARFSLEREAAGESGPLQVTSVGAGGQPKRQRREKEAAPPSNGASFSVSQRAARHAGDVPPVQIHTATAIREAIAISTPQWIKICQLRNKHVKSFLLTRFTPEQVTRMMVDNGGDDDDDDDDDDDEDESSSTDGSTPSAALRDASRQFKAKLHDPLASALRDSSNAQLKRPAGQDAPVKRLVFPPAAPSLDPLADGEPDAVSLPAPRGTRTDIGGSPIIRPVVKGAPRKAAAPLALTSTSTSTSTSSNPLKPVGKPISSSPPRAGRVPWTEEETKNLVEGVRLHGYGNWAEILRGGNFHRVRDAVSLKDKARNIKLAPADH